MADIYEVTADKVTARSKKSTKASSVKTYSFGKELTIYVKEVGEDNKQWGSINKKNSKWVPMDKLRKIGSTASSSKEEAGRERENLDTAEDDNVYGASDADYNKVLLRHIRAFGSPPRYTPEVDPWYGLTNETGTGRVMSKTWFSDPSILSLAPGTVDYLPGFNRAKGKNKFFNAVKSAAGGIGISDLMKADKKMDINGPLYEFKSAYTDYYNIVNLMARVSSMYMGIGDTPANEIIAGAPAIPLKNFDYSYWTSPENVVKGGNGIFSAAANALNSALKADGSYVHFFVNHTGVQVSEQISATSKDSWFENQIGSDSDVSTFAENMQFLFGGPIGNHMADDLQAVVDSASDASNLLGGLGHVMSNYMVKGGKLVFPKIITGMKYDKAMNCELSFASPYGDKKSIFRHVILPSLHLLAMAVPKQLSANMYTYPFLVRGFQRGQFIMDLAFISNLDFTRGGSDNTSWTVDGLPTEVTARFSLMPLYTNLMVTSSRNPFLFMQNSALIEYLGNMVGLDMLMNNLDKKVEVSLSLIHSYISGIPTNFARKAIEGSKILKAYKGMQTLIKGY